MFALVQKNKIFFEFLNLNLKIKFKFFLLWTRVNILNILAGPVFNTSLLKCKRKT